ncbi:MAG: TerB family tellurite resistance protein [Pseudomonadota bacterium]
MTDLFKQTVERVTTTTDDMQLLFKPTTEEDKKATVPDLDALSQDFKSSTDWDIPEAYLCLIIAAAFADGDLAEEERDEIAALVKRSRTMKRLNADGLARANQVVNRRMAERGADLSAEQACQTLPMDMRLSVFAHCVDIVLADGELHPTEATFLNQITAWMSLDAEDAKNVLTSIMIKNRY